MERKTLFSDWFNVKDKNHLLAYEYLLDEGQWPKHFIPADVQMEEGWQGKINFNIVKEHIRMVCHKTYRGEGGGRERIPQSNSI